MPVAMTSHLMIPPTKEQRERDKRVIDTRQERDRGGDGGREGDKRGGRDSRYILVYTISSYPQPTHPAAQ